MEDDLKLFKISDNPNFFYIWNTASNFLKMEDDLKFSNLEDNFKNLKMKDDLNLFENGRRVA